MFCLLVQAKQSVHEKFWTEPSNQAFLGHDVMEFEDGSADSRALAGRTENASKQTIAFRYFYIYNYKVDISEFKACLGWLLVSAQYLLLAGKWNGHAASTHSPTPSPEKGIK